MPRQPAPLADRGIVVPGQGRGGRTMRYFTDAGPTKGPLRRCYVDGSIAVFESPGNHRPIGAAHPVAWTEDGVAIWRLEIGGHEHPGRWMSIDREFTPASITNAR